MTFLYALVLGVFYWRTGKKDPLSKVFKSGKGGDGEAGGKGSGKGGGKAGGGKNVVLKLWHNVRILILFAIVVLILASPLTIFGVDSVGQALGKPTLWALGLFASIVNVGGAALATALLFIAVILFLVDTLADWEINKLAKHSLIAIPLLTLISIGPISLWMQDVNTTVRTAATNSVSWAWGR